MIMPAALSMCVTLFFAVNGYLMLVKKRSFKELVKKNIKIVFLIFFWGLLRASFQTIILGREITPTGVFSDFFAFKVGYGNYLWFLVAISILNLTNPLIYAFIKNSTRNEKYTFCLLLLCFTANFINVLSWKFNPLAHWYHYESIFYYVTGFFLISSAAHIKWPWWKCGLAFLFFFILQVIQNFVFEMNLFSRFRISDRVFGNYASLWVMGETLTMILLFSKFNLKSNKLISFIGRNTLGIYLLQDFFCSITRNTMPREYTFIYPILILGVCLSLLWIFEKNSYLNWFVKI